MSIHKSRILYEDEHLLAISKLSNELVVKGSGNVQKLPLLDLLKEDYPTLKALHRLDFETSGVVVFAKTKQVAEVVRQQGTEDWVKKYVTIASGRFSRRRGIIKNPLPARNSKQTVPAETRYQVLKQYVNSAYVELQIMTGRYHQIRRHLANTKHALVLDTVYGDKRYNGTFKQEFKYQMFFLHAQELSMKHPITKEQITITAPMPRPFEQCLKKLEPFII